MKKSQWFEVDKDGLSRLFHGRARSIVLFELLQNSFDTEARTVHMTLKHVSRGTAELWIKDDDPNGFLDLGDAYTLFAPSGKLKNPEKRGRFNIGEKFVLSLCLEAIVHSTTGTVYFQKDGSRKINKRAKTSAGTVIHATLNFSKEDVEEFRSAVRKIIVPNRIDFTFNGDLLPKRRFVERFEAFLPTVGCNVNGEMIRTTRKTRVDIYETDSPGWIYEMGIPVVETGDRYDVDVQQKVPLSISRDNVPPAFLSKLRAHVLNATAHFLEKDEAANTWVNDAIETDDVSSLAVHEVLTKRFGARRVIHDPSDPEANDLAASKGYTVIPGRSLSKAAWDNVRTFEAAKPAGQVTPSPKPFDPDGKPLKTRPPDTPGMKEFDRFARYAGKVLLDRSISITYADDPGWNFGGAYGDGHLTVNARRYGQSFFDSCLPKAQRIGESRMSEVLRFLLHEFAHEYESNHLSENFHETISRLGAKLAIAIASLEIILPH
jgi:hypothetical protein